MVAVIGLVVPPTIFVMDRSDRGVEEGVHRLFIAIESTHAWRYIFSTSSRSAVPASHIFSRHFAVFFFPIFQSHIEDTHEYLYFRKTCGNMLWSVIGFFYRGVGNVINKWRIQQVYALGLRSKHSCFYTTHVFSFQFFSFRSYRVC